MTTRRLLTAVTASLSLSLGGLALVLGVADLASVSANVWMRGWEEQGYLSDPAQWDAAYSRLSLARRLNPLSADYSADLGLLMGWRSLRPSPTGAQYAAYRASAVNFYGESVGKRPSWGYAWARYAESQLLLGNQGYEFLQALEKAIALAPWEPGVQRKVAWMGLATWDDLPERLRIVVKESVRRTIELGLYLDEVVRLAVQFGWLDQLIPMMRTDGQRKALERILKQLEQR